MKLFKTCFLFLITVLMFTLSSCSDDENGITEHNLIGSWQPVSSEGWEIFNNEKDYYYAEAGDPDFDDDIITILPNGNGHYSNGNANYKFTWSLKDGFFLEDLGCNYDFKYKCEKSCQCDNITIFNVKMESNDKLTLAVIEDDFYEATTYHRIK